MALDLSKLNQEQKKAVVYKQGPLLIVAGAGTGKTTVITQRIVYLIEKKLAQPEEILAVTFTDKAASEMEERVDTLLPYSYLDLWISTFHSFCERVLRDYGLNIGLPADFKVLDETAAWLLVRRNFDQFKLDYYKPLGSPTKFIQALLSHFSHCKNQGIYPEDYLEYSEKLKTRDDLPENKETERIKEVANAYHSYQKLILSNGYLDFGDLINYCLKLFQKRPFILKKYQDKFKYILVDEFQDTNWAQYELIKTIALPKNNLTVTADDDQMIYLWRSASFNNIIQFTKDFPKAEKVSLVKNYRSKQNILDLAYKFIKNNDPDRLECISEINKKLIAQGKGKGEIEHISAFNLEQETAKTMEKIVSLLRKDKKASYNDFAILVRANDHANVFVKALDHWNLPYQFFASRGLYFKPVVMDMISYFKILDNYHESSAVYRVLCFSVFDIPIEELMKFSQYSQKKAVSFYQAMNQVFSIPNISLKTKEKINFILSLIKKHSYLAQKKPVSEVFVNLLEETGYLKHLVKNNNKQSLDFLNQFYKRIKKFETSSLESGLNNFMEEINFEIEAGDQGQIEFDPEQGPETIKIMTIHAAKGLEFKYVFLVNMVDKRFPTIRRKDLIELPEELIKDIKPSGDVHLQEERRICYVGLTRAKQGVYLTSAQDYGGQTKKKLSRFMSEMNFQEKPDKLKIKPENDLLDKKTSLPEKKELKTILGYLPESFSFSQLNVFNDCPLKYKFKFILRIPIKGKAVFSFGQTIHNALYQFLNQVNQTKQKDLFNQDNSIKIKQDYFKKLNQLYQENWIDEWYQTEKQKQEYYKLGQKIIKAFYKDFKEKSPKILMINNQPALEQKFKLKINNHVIKGVIDRIDQENNEIIIIDYKTGLVKDKLTIQEKEQLLIYQIAVEEIFNFKPKKLIYHYLNDNKKISFIGSEKDKQKIKQKIISQIERIKKGDFKPTPGWQCNYCDFKDICDSAKL